MEALLQSTFIARSTRVLCMLLVLSMASALAENPTPAEDEDEIEQIQLPFGLEWEMTATRVSEMLRASSARVRDRRVRGAQEVWTIIGLQRTGLKHALFAFERDILVEVELQYEYAGWDGKKYRGFFDQVRGNVEQRHGKGTLIMNTSGPHRDVLQTIVGYQWNQPDTSMRLFFYEATREKEAFHSVSLHYYKVQGG